ncbi:hypothetical protein IAT38_005609 [Cryptococcus sp. DSM 104549]
MPHKRAKRSVREAEQSKKGYNLDPSTSSYNDTPGSAARILNSWKVQSAFRESGRKTSEDTGAGGRKGAPGKEGGKDAGGKGKGKSAGAEGGEKEEKTKLPKILPQESLGEYNRRIESLLRPSVSKAIKDAAGVKAAEEAAARREKKERKKRARLEKLVKEGKLPASALDEKKRKRDDEDDEGSGAEGEDGDGSEGEEGGEVGPKRKKEKTFATAPAPRRLNDIVQAPPSLPHLKRASGEKTTGKGVYGAVGKGSGKVPLNAGQQRILEEERERVVKLYREMKATKEAERAEASKGKGKK